MKRILISLLMVLLLLTPVLATDETPALSAESVSTTKTSVSAPEYVGSIRVIQTKYDPAPAEPGKRVTLWVSIQNWGGEKIDNAIFKLEPSYPFSLEPRDDGIRSTGIIQSFRDVLLEYNLLVDEGAVEDTYELKLRHCKDLLCESWYKTVKLKITVKTGGAPKIEAGLEDFDIFWGGKTGKITFNVVNRGKLDVRFLMLTLLPSDKYEIISPSRIYIGELESDDFDTADFTIYVKEDVGKSETEEIILPLKLEYSDENYKEYTQYQDIPFKIYSQKDLKKMQLVEQGRNNLIWYIGIIVILVVGYLLYRKYKKRKIE